MIAAGCVVALREGCAGCVNALRVFARALRCVKLLRVARLRGEAADEVEVANEVEGEVDEKLCRTRGLLKKLLALLARRWQRCGDA